jgi:hypothetical protein
VGHDAPKICRAARRRACRNSKCEGYNHNIERPPGHYKGHLCGGLSVSARPHGPAARVLSRGLTGEASLQRGPISEMPGMCREDGPFTRCRHGVKLLKRLERAKGIEPSYAAWEAPIPLRYCRQWLRDSGKTLANQAFSASNWAFPATAGTMNTPRTGYGRTATLRKIPVNADDQTRAIDGS